MRSSSTHTRRRRAWLALLVGLVVVLLLVGGWAGRTRPPMGDGRLVAATPAGPTAGPVVGAAGPAPDTTTASGAAPGATPVGPARLEAGVPVGWAATRAGAVAAAAAYTTTTTAPWFVTDPARRRQALVAIAAPGAVGRLVNDQDLASAQLLAGPLGQGLGRVGMRALLRSGVLGYRLERYTPTAATVSLWVVVLYGHDGGLAPQTVWGTTQVRLARAGGDWRLAGLRTVPGPVPTNGPQPPEDPAAFFDRAGAFQEPRYGAG